jgi:hypothetical protein
MWRFRRVAEDFLFFNLLIWMHLAKNGALARIPVAEEF